MDKKKNKEIFDALSIIEKEKGIPVEYMIDKIQKAVSSACRSNYGNDNIVTDINPKKYTFDVYLVKEVVENVEHDGRQISLKDAKNIDDEKEIGDVLELPLEPSELGRIAVATARNIIRQAIRDGERGMIMQELQKYIHEIVTARVERIEKNGTAVLRFSKYDFLLPINEQMKDETLKIGSHIKVYMLEVVDGPDGANVFTSRTNPDFVKRLFESEIPEIQEGIIEVKSIAREAGSRTKIAVSSNDENVNPVGSCIGAKGFRVGRIVDELGGEEIDIVEYSNEPKKFITLALAPANVLKVELDTDDENSCKVTVPDNQISLAIGARGQNVRLAAKLTGWKIDIIPESGFYQGDEEDNDIN